MGSGRGMDVRRSPDSTETLAGISLGKEGGRSPSRAEPPVGTSAQPPTQLSRRLTGKCQDTGPGPRTGASWALVGVWPGCVCLWDTHLRPRLATQRPTLFHHPKCLRPACWIPPSLGETKPRCPEKVTPPRTLPIKKRSFPPEQRSLLRAGGTRRQKLLGVGPSQEGAGET